MSTAPELRIGHHLLYYTLRVSIPTFSLLPLGLLRPLGASIGGFSLNLSQRERRRAESQLAIAFPDASDERRRQILRAWARHLGKNLAEIVWLTRASFDQVENVLSCSGLENLSRPLDRGQGVVMLTAHCGNWEFINPALRALDLPLSAVVRELYDPRLDRLSGAIRQRFGTEVIPRNFRAGHQIAAALSKGRIVILLIDQDIKSIPGVFAPFFGRLAWTPIGAAKMAIRSKCPLVPVFMHRGDDGRHYLEALPALETPDPGLAMEERIHELTASANLVIENQIRRFPEQWVWNHRRWRTRPPEESAKS